MPGGEGDQAMSNPDRKPPQGHQDWEGFREVDRAIAENRLTSYTWKKAWADPWGRLKLAIVFLGLAAFVVYVIIYDQLI